MSTSNHLDEEAWEADVSTLLSGLPFVDPPPGLIDDALNHRPLNAGRTLVVLAAVAVASVGAWLATGNIESNFVVPPVADLVAQHDATSGDGDAEVLNSNFGFTVGSGSDAVQIEKVPDGTDVPVSLPEGFERQATFAGAELEQQIFANPNVGDGAGPVSVFIQQGTVDFDELPGDGRITIDGVAAWSDPASQTVVVQAADSTVTIVGLSEEDVTEMIQMFERPDSFVEGVGRRLGEWTAQLGFADLG